MAAAATEFFKNHRTHHRRNFHNAVAAKAIAAFFRKKYKKFMNLHRMSVFIYVY
jgi:hypothetical protein